MTSATPAYLPDGSCRFCQTPTRFGGEAHAPSCPYAAALCEITDQLALCVEYAACLVAELRVAGLAYWHWTDVVPTTDGSCSACGSSAGYEHFDECKFSKANQDLIDAIGARP